MKSVTIRMSERGIITIPKPLRESYNLHPGDTFSLIDLGGVFVLSPQRSEIDVIADKIAAQWEDDEESLESVLLALREKREQRGR